MDSGSLKSNDSHLNHQLLTENYQNHHITGIYNAYKINYGT